MSATYRHATAAAALSLFLPLGALAQAGPNVCGELGNGYGPFDYRTEHGEPKALVEGAHFKPQIEALISGKTSDSTAGGDIDYTLRAFPNHHRALLAMIRLGEKEKTDKPSGSRYTVECWLERAIRFRPDDGIARMVYVNYLTKKGRVAEATRQLEVVAAATDDNSFTQYNIGMLYFDLKNYDRALTQAHRAMALGFPRTGLRDRLRSVGKWVDAPTVESSTDAGARAANTAVVATPDAKSSTDAGARAANTAVVATPDAK